MKTKITISLLVTANFLFITNVSKAQWSPGTGYVYPTTTTDKVIIGSSTTPLYPLQVNSSNIVGNLSSGDSLAVGISHNTTTAVGMTKGSTRHAVFGTTQVTADILFVNKVSSTYDYYERMRINRFGRVGIGTPTPDTSALLDVSSTNKGLLIPRIALVSTTDAATITLPATSLLVYNILGGGLTPAGYWYNAGSSSSPNWVQLISTATSGSWLLTGNSISSGDFIGTTNNQDFVVKTFGSERMRVLAGGNVGIGITVPATLLHTKSAASTDNEIRIDVTSGANKSIVGFANAGTDYGQLYFDNSTNNVALYQKYTSGDLLLGTNSVTNVIVKNGGNVGIGIVSPVCKLHILDVIGNVASNTAVTGTGNVSIQSSYAGRTAGTGAALTFALPANTDGTNIYEQARILGAADNSTNVNASGRMYLQTRYYTGSAWDWKSNLVLVSNGNVGIGTTAPGAKLDVSGTSNFTGTMTVNGNINGSGTFNYTSDQLFKTNVDSLQNALTTISQLKPKSYYFDTTNVYGLNFSNKKQYGFIAQDVETILPELITETTKLADYDTSGNVVHPAVTYKGLNYNAFFGILTKGIQEQSNEIDSLKTKTNNQDSISTALQKAQQQSIDSLRTKMVAQDSTNVLLQNSLNQLMAKTNYLDSINASLQDQLNQLLNCCNNNGNNGHGNNLMPSDTNNSGQNNKSMNVNDGIPQSGTTLTDVELSNKNIVVLNQNVPNPFAEQTTITYFLPDNVTRAQILFFEQSGKIIKTIDLTERGKGQLNVFANDLSSGIYTYSLIVDGKVTESKKMVKQ